VDQNGVEQGAKKSDFKPDEEQPLSANCTPACSKATQFLEIQINAIKDCLNGKNLITILHELGIRTHKTLLDHIRQQVFNTMGGVQLTYDLTAYEKTFALLADPFVSELMDTLKELSRLLVVKLDSVQQLIFEGRLATMDKFILQSFLALRVDYKTGKLAHLFKS